MTDQFPTNMEIEIDRTRLRRYLRVKYFVSWCGLLVIFGALFGLASAEGTLKKHDDPSPAVVRHTMLTGLTRGVAISCALATTCYLVLSHWPAAKEARTARLAVAGPFLCIRQGAFVQSDRKLHVRAAVDYAVLDTWFARLFGIATLQITTMAGTPQSTIRIPGVKNCLAVRDLLAKIDAAREM